ncbi:MAG: alpha-amylase family glycosyl hydrolase [Cloacibacterium sp.]
MKKIVLASAFAFLASCASQNTKTPSSFDWKGANVYFAVTDRFNNGNPDNDVIFNRTEKAAVLRGFEGGDIRGVIQKIDEGYFNKLGINAIWLTPIVEQIHGATDEGTGLTYAYHGYWTKDWTALDPNFGTEEDLKELVEKAHQNGIRIVLDAVINHTGPVTYADPEYPNKWVRTEPQCTYNSYEMTTACTLVKNIPDVITESDENVGLPPMLEQKWRKEGRYEKEMSELNVFFVKTGFPRAPKYYIMKWLADYIVKYGIDGYRIDTLKHTNEDVWKDFKKVCDLAFAEYKLNNPKKILDNSPFFTIGELYGYGISQKKLYDFGDKKVNYYQNGLNSLINFDFKGDANKSYEEIFSNYDKILHTDLSGNTVMNYISSHDDGDPFDKERKRNYEAGTKLLLAPGISQVYYGDETARKLIVEGAIGDANLRSNMNWDEIKYNPETQKVLTHWQKLGQFRRNHAAVGAGKHQMVSNSPYWFTRTYKDDKVLVGLDLNPGVKEISVTGIFENGTRLRDAYSGKTAKVSNGKVSIDSEFGIVLYEKL